MRTLHRGSLALGGAALGAIGADTLSRARSRYFDGQESMMSSTVESLATSMMMPKGRNSKSLPKGQPVNLIRPSDEIISQERNPGRLTSANNKDITDENEMLKLGKMPVDPELTQTICLKLEGEDNEQSPKLGHTSLVEEFERNIKREYSADGPMGNKS